MVELEETGKPNHLLVGHLSILLNEFIFSIPNHDFYQGTILNAMALYSTAVHGQYFSISTGLSPVSLFVLLKFIFPADLLPLVLITLIIGYADHENNYFSAETKFATAITSIIPLSYYIGMGIAR